MKKLLFTYSTLCGTGLLLACASQPPIPAPMTAKPLDHIAGAGQRADGYYQLGRFYEGQNRFDQAIDAYREAVQTWPDNIGAWDNLCYVLHFDERASGEEILAENRAWAARFEAPVPCATLPATSTSTTKPRLCSGPLTSSVR